MPILKNFRSWVGGYDMTTDIAQVSLDLDHETQDDTRFQPVGSGGARARVCGLEDVSSTVSGYNSPLLGGVDANNFAAWSGGLEEPWTQSFDGVEGNPAYVLRGGRFKYSQFGPVGSNSPFSVDVKGTNGECAAVRGLVTKSPGVVSGTGATGTGVNLGAVGAAQFLYVAVHSFVAGTTITIQVQHATSGAFSSPITVGSMTAITTVGGFMTRFAGPFAGPFYRINVTAITGSFTIAATLAIR